MSGKCQESLLKVSGGCLDGVQIVSTSCLVGVWTYLDCVWTMSRLYLEHKTCLESVWTSLECVWMCLEHVWPVSGLCLEHVRTFVSWTCLDCDWTMVSVSRPWTVYVYGSVWTLSWPCLDIVVTVYGMDCVWILSIQCQNVSLSCLKPAWTLSISQTASPPTSLGAKIHLG